MENIVCRQIQDDLALMKHLRMLLDHKTYLTSNIPESDKELKSFEKAFLSGNDKADLDCFHTCFRRAQEFRYQIDYLDYVCATDIHARKYASDLDAILQKITIKIASTLPGDNHSRLVFQHHKLGKVYDTAFVFYKQLTDSIDARHPGLRTNEVQLPHRCYDFLEGYDTALRKVAKQLDLYILAMKDLLDELAEYSLQ